MIFSITSAVLALCLSQAGTSDSVDGHAYEKRATRTETLAHMMAQLSPSQVVWGSWYQCAPFPYAGHDQDDLATLHAPEMELDRMRAGQAPDLTAKYQGKNGAVAEWIALGPMAGKRIDLHRSDDPALSDLVAGYLYTTIEAPVAQRVEYSFGSDDGCRFWLNGKLLFHKDVPRGLNPAEDTIVLDLHAGTNHVLIEVVDGYGGWEFQILTEKQLSTSTDAQLSYLLDRDFPPSPMRAHYTAFTIPIPEDLVIEVGGLSVLPDGRPALSTRRGDVYFVVNAYEEPPLHPVFQHYAEGLHEPLGLEWRMEEGELKIYVVQRGELTRLYDQDIDVRADLYETFCDDWGVSGNYHEFAFGPKFDNEGNAWVTLNVGFCGSLGKAIVPWRGWAVKITPEGELIPVCSGLRSPNGIGKWKDGEMFYVDNQGDYVATNRLSHLAQDSYQGHPAGLRWRDDMPNEDSPKPPRQRASIWFPYKRMGQSTADIVLDTTGGKFGPFSEQFFVGDQMNASVMRADLELVNGHYQGACYPFIEGLDSGVNRMAFAPDGSMFVGQTDRGWGSKGKRSYGLQRLVWNGSTPFEILHMTVWEHGFDLEFTGDIAGEAAADPAAYEMTSFTYEYHADYGAPETDREDVAVTEVRQLGPRMVRLTLSSMRAGYVHELRASGVRSSAGAPLVHADAYYTLMEIPGRASGEQAMAEGKPRVLFLTHSAGYMHGVVTRPSPEELSHAEATLIEAAGDDYDIIATQDCSTINARTLADVDVVMFYTTGDLPIAEEDRAALIDWVQAGGAFVGIHCATDTWYDFEDYGELMGGYFDGHPWHEEVRMAVDEHAHPSTSHLGESWTLTDEIYQFKDWVRFGKQTLLHLDEGGADLEKGKREDGDYANSWCKPFGAGRMFYTALGHRPEVWTNPDFMQHLLGGVDWALHGPDVPVAMPEGAELLIGEGTLDLWTHEGGRDTQWTEADGVMTITPGSGNLFTKNRFKDFELHLEFSPPVYGPETTGQARGNSGLYIMGQYELQILDSYGLEPGMGDCGACYGVALPKHASYRPPGTWSSYDVEFRAPRFDEDGNKLENARVTAWLNGRKIHDDLEIPGPTAGAWRSDEAPMAPIMLQDHGDPVRFRNMWVVRAPGTAGG